MKEKYTREGITIFRRYNSPAAVFYTRMRVDGKVKTLSLAETADESFKIAIAARRARISGKFDLYKAVMQKRNPEAARHTIADLLPHYRAYPGNILARTKESNINALHRFIADTHQLQAGTLNDNAWASVRLDELTEDLVLRWKDHIQTLTRAEDVDDDRRATLLRSANSTLAQARSLFARSRRNDFPAYYKRAGNIELPACIAKFKAVPGFSGAQKTEYNPPDATIIRNTLAALEQLGRSTDAQDLNIFKACWVTLGFGLRASHVARTLCGDFQRDLSGDIFYRPLKYRAGKASHDIGVQLDAWERLAPHVDNKPAGDYLLTGTATERTTDVFRRISSWMKGLGWQTTHHLHELRAWAGCQVVGGPDGKSQNWEAGRRFLKHKYVSTTQNYYGHHFQARIEKVPLPNLAVA